MATRWQLIFVTLCTLLPAPLARADTFGSGTNTFDIQFVEIGDPGNPGDTGESGGYLPDPPGAGAVDYVYNIARYEISRDMITKANAVGGLGITLQDMTGIGGNSSSKPATGINWLEAVTFVNWLNSSSGHPKAYKVNGNSFDVWQPSDAGYDRDNLFRNSLAHYFLPSADEWYKAAYYDPDANDGDGGYWRYPTGRDTEPNPVASGTSAGTAVFLQGLEAGPAVITQAGGRSPYGVMGLGGNVQEWEETEEDLVNDGNSTRRGFRGGYWDSDFVELSASLRLSHPMTGAGPYTEYGFRVASVAPPSLPGDFNENGQLDSEDLDLQAQVIMGQPGGPEYDLNNDDVVDYADREIWVEELKNTWIGDANLNGEFNSGDMVQVFSRGKYETGQSAGWEDGDWNGDTVFGSGDMVAAFVAGGYEKGLRPGGPNPAVSAVPEPASVTLLVTVLIGLASFRRRLGLRARCDLSRYDLCLRFGSLRKPSHRDDRNLARRQAVARTLRRSGAPYHRWTTLSQITKTEAEVISHSLCPGESAESES